MSELKDRLADIARKLLEIPPELRGPFKVNEVDLRKVASASPTPPGSEPSSALAEAMEVIRDTTAHLIAAHSLLARSVTKKAAPSNKMLDQMLKDYKASFERGRAFPHSKGE